MAEPDPSRDAADRHEKLALALLLGLHLALALLSANRKSLTFDEHTHLAAGLSYVETRDPRLNPEHPPLPKLLAAAPLALTDVTWDASDPAWERAGAWVPLARTGRLAAERPAARAAIVSEWEFAASFLYRLNRERLAGWVFAARLPTILLSLLTGWLVFRWARELWGRPAALFALTVYVFSPTVLAHGRLVTTDTCYTLFNTLTLYLLARLLSHGPHARAPLGLCLGLAGALAGAFLSKYSGLFLLPVLGLCLAWFTWRRPEARGAYALRRGAELLAAAAGAALLTWLASLLVFGEGLYLTGCQVVLGGYPASDAFKSYLLGETGERFAGYFVVALLLKTTLPALILGAGWLALVARERLWREPVPALLLLFGLPFFALVTLRFPNVGVRYLLPLYPLLALASGQLFARAITHPRLAERLRSALSVILLAHVLSGALAFPNYLSYMNGISLTRGKAYFLADSNLDWGQDLPALGEYCRARGLEQIFLTQFGVADATFYGVPARSIHPRDLGQLPSGAVVAVSVNYLQLHPSLRATAERFQPQAFLNDTILVFEVP